VFFVTVFAHIITCTTKMISSRNFLFGVIANVGDNGVSWCHLKWAVDQLFWNLKDCLVCLPHGRNWCSST